MPIYEYSCRGCDQEFELLVRGSEQPECPKCGGHDLQKLLSVPAAPVTQRAGLPVTQRPMEGGCGRPQCGGGFCAGLE
jgi:putative FmdB family regulatory protein